MSYAVVGDEKIEIMKYRVSHYSQIPCKPFILYMGTLKEAGEMMNILAEYDQFQLTNRIKPDYANAQVLEQWDEGDQKWESWYDDATGIEDVNEYLEYVDSTESAK